MDDEYEGLSDERSEEGGFEEADVDLDDEERMVINPTSVRDRIDVSNTHFKRLLNFFSLYSQLSLLCSIH